MNVRSDSFRPYDRLDARWAFGAPDPVSHVRLSDNQNPHLAWDGVPPGTASFAVICVDPDAPSEGSLVNREGVTVPVYLERADFFHWVLVDLPPSVRHIAKGSHSAGVTPRGKPPGPSPDGGIVGLNDYTGWFSGNPDMEGQYFGYDGPGPPWNDERVHAYEFQVHALDVASLGLPAAFSGQDARRAMAGHVLGSSRVVGLYSIYL